MVMFPNNCTHPGVDAKPRSVGLGVEHHTGSVHLTPTTLSSLSSQIVIKDPHDPAKDIVYTSADQTKPGMYRICYATREAILSGFHYLDAERGLGHSADDYIELFAINFTTFSPPNFFPNRLVLGAERPITVHGSDLALGDSVAFTQWPNCSKLKGYKDGLTGPSGDYRDETGYTEPWQTREYKMTAPLTTDVKLHKSIGNGTFILCFLPSGGTNAAVTGSGTWTKIEGIALTVISPPEFTPHVSIAGARTPVIFSGGFPRHKVVPVNASKPLKLKAQSTLNRDVVVLQENNCVNAHLQTTDRASLRRTELSTLRGAKGTAVHSAFETKLNMTKPSQLVVCYATMESGGYREDDYIQLTAWGLTALTRTAAVTSLSSTNPLHNNNPLGFHIDRSDAVKALSTGVRDWVLGTTVNASVSPQLLLDQRHPPEFTPKRVVDRRHIARQSDPNLELGTSARNQILDQEVHILNGTFGDR
jgi:hypothetical protein